MKIKTECECSCFNRNLIVSFVVEARVTHLLSIVSKRNSRSERQTHRDGSLAETRSRATQEQSTCTRSNFVTVITTILDTGSSEGVERTHTDTGDEGGD